MGEIFKTDKVMKLGIWGLGRGRAFVELSKLLNIEIVAGCDYSEMMQNDFHKLCPDAYVSGDEDEFLKQDMDVVLVSTYFTNHANDCIKALKAGKHVISEVAAFFTPADGVRLVEAVEESGKLYCLSENYTDQFVKKLWKDGVFGELSYAEFDYVHECRPLSYSYLYGDPMMPGNIAHSWRSWLNFHYYCTHSLGAAMETTGTRPVKVAAPVGSKSLPGYLPSSEMGNMCPSFVTMDNGGIIRNLMGSSTSDSHTRRIWGTRAFVDLTTGEPVVGLGQCGHGPKVTLTAPETELTKYASRFGHNGGDFWVFYNFANMFFNGEKYYWDIYTACDVTLTGIMAVKSLYNGGIPVDVPDFRDKAIREKYRNDNFAQQHLDPKKIFPDDQNYSETKHFSCIVNELDRAWEFNGVPLIIATLDGMKLYPYLKDLESKNTVQQNVRKLISVLPTMVDTFRNARYLADKYPGSPAGRALQAYLDSAYPDKMEDPLKLRDELVNWLRRADMPCDPQLSMYLTADKINSVVVPPIPEGFTLRKFQPGEDQAYIDLMKSAGFDYWNQKFADDAKRIALDGGIFFLVDNATGRLAATAMADNAKGGQNGEGALGWVAANPDFRGKHLAEIVCQTVVDFYRKAGYTRLTLLTDDFRIPAIRTYLKCGWRPIINDEKMDKRWDRVCKKLGIQLEDIGSNGKTANQNSIFKIR